MAELKKNLGFWMVSAIAFLSLINTGLFFGIKIGADQAGQSSLVAWAILSILSIYMAMCFAELTAMFPTAGGVYEFAKQAYGRFTSFLFGWIVWVSGNIATALFIVAAMEYIMPASPTLIAGVWVSAAVLKLAACIAIIVALNYIAYRGIDTSARVMIFLSLFMLGVMAVILIPGAGNIDVANLTGFTVQWSLVMLAVFYLSETFYGWEAVSFMSEETEDATRTIPRALIGTAAFVAIIAVLIALVTIGSLGIAGVKASERPIIAMLTGAHVPLKLLLIVNIGIVIALLGNASSNIVSLPRLLLAMSRDKLFIEQFSDVHPQRQTPYKAIIFQSVIAIFIVLIASGAYEKLLELLVPVSLIMYAGIVVLVPYFRITQPDRQRPYRAPLGKLLPWLIAAFYLTLLVFWAMNATDALAQLRLLFSFLFFSIPIYLILTYFYDPDKLIGTMSFFSRVSVWFENALLPRRIRLDILDDLKNSSDKHVLEFGSGVGTFTLHLAEHVGKGGKVYAIGMSKSDATILEERVRKRGHMHVEVIHDPHLISRVHPSVKNVDMIVSIGHLSYIQDVPKVLKEMASLLPHRGHIYFVEYIDLFYFLPNPKWLSDEDEVKRIFQEAGFNVTVKIRRGLFWKYLTISGLKESRNVPFI